MEKISIRLPDGTMIENAEGLQVHISDGASTEIRRVDELVRAHHEQYRRLRMEDATER